MAAGTTDDALTALSVRTLEALDDVAQWMEQIDLSTVTPDEIQDMRDRLQRLERAAVKVQERLGKRQAADTDE